MHYTADDPEDIIAGLEFRARERRECADMIEQQAARLTALESEHDALLAAAGKEAVMPLSDKRIWGIAEDVWRRRKVRSDREFELQFAHEVIAAALYEIRAAFTDEKGPEFSDGPDSDGFSGPRPWNGFNGAGRIEQEHSDALAGDINPRGKQ
jgi:hypothetical protein